MKKRFFIILSVIIASLNLSSQQREVKKADYPLDYESKIDVIYSKVNNWEGRLDVYYNPTNPKLMPLIINIHGGGWKHGTKESQNGFSPFFNAGFAVANVEYRLVDVAKAPAAIEDIRSALNYLIVHAKELNINPHKIVIMGASAGAHLALMGGLLENDHRFDMYCKNKKVDMRVAAIVSKYAPSDFVTKTNKSYSEKTLLDWLGSKAEDTAFRESVSPNTYIKKTSPPVFIIHGNADPLVPYEQSVRLQKQFQDVGVKNEFITVEGGKHGNFEKSKNDEINIAIIAFLKGVGVL